MKKKVDALRRVERFQERLQTLSDWRIEQLRAQRRALELTRSELLASLSKDFACLGNMSRLLTARLIRIEKEITANLQAEENELRRRRMVVMRLKLLERRIGTLDAENRARLERSLSLEAIEAWLAGHPSSSMQA